jgi:hypothetical protein
MGSLCIPSGNLWLRTTVAMLSIIPSDIPQLAYSRTEQKLTEGRQDMQLLLCIVGHRSPLLGACECCDDDALLWLTRMEHTHSSCGGHLIGEKFSDFHKPKTKHRMPGYKTLGGKVFIRIRSTQNFLHYFFAVFSSFIADTNLLLIILVISSDIRLLCVIKSKVATMFNS